MAEKKQTRWEENRDLIKEVQMELDELDDNYKELKELVSALVNANSDLIQQIMQSTQTNFRRPNLIKNHAKSLKELVEKLQQ